MRPSLNVLSTGWAAGISLRQNVIAGMRKPNIESHFGAGKQVPLPGSRHIPGTQLRCSLSLHTWGLVMSEMTYRYVENPSAQEIFCHHLHEVEVIGAVTRFIPIVLKRTADGLLGEVPFTILLPNEAVGPALALTWQRMPSGVIVPAVGNLVRRMMALH